MTVIKVILLYVKAIMLIRQIYWPGEQVVLDRLLNKYEPDRAI